MSHTPGPWRVDPEMNELVLWPNGRYLAEVMNQNAADALLIAAAPDLLQAAKEAYIALHESKHNQDINEMLRAAFKKAGVHL